MNSCEAKQSTREAFEAWFSDGGKDQRAIERDSAGSYKLMSAYTAWNVWRACAEWQASAQHGTAPQQLADIARVAADRARFLRWIAEKLLVTDDINIRKEAAKALLQLTEGVSP